MDTMQFLQSMSLAILAGLCAVIYRQVLAYKMPFVNKFFQWGQKYEGKKWFYPIVWGCSQCLSGQLALWLYLATHFRVVILTENATAGHFMSAVAISPTNLQYSIVGHILAICAAIYLSAIFTNYYNKAENGA